MTAAVAKSLDLVALVKPRILMMALLTAAGAMTLAPGVIAPADALWLLAGTGLIVGSANTLNMWLERDIDCLMSRTKHRPLPQGRLASQTALVFGAVQGALSIPALAMVNLVTAALGLLALVLYVGVYTPMKQRSHWSVWIGAIPGAMPALMGWTAATGRIDLPGLAVSLVLVPLGVAGVAYLVTALALGAFVLAQGLPGIKAGSAKWARNVFLASIIYLPVLFAVMVVDGRA